MRVLIVSQYFWPESFRINDLATGLRDRGHEVTVLTGLPNYPEGKIFPGFGMFSKGEVHQGIRIHRVPMLSRGQSRGLRLIANYASYALSASLLGPLRCRAEYDVILAFQISPVTVGIPAAVMKWCRSAPILFWVQDIWPETLSATGAVKSPWVLKQVARLVKKIYSHCDRVLIQSENYFEPITSLGYPASRIEYFPNWSESIYQPFSRQDVSEIDARLPSGFRIMFAGNIGASQSFETILQAASHTRDLTAIQWIILGDGRRRSFVESEIARLKLSGTVHLFERRPQEEMPRYFAAADAMLCTLGRSPVFSMTVPSKLQSYMACGKPILAAIDGMSAEVIRRSGAGYVAAAEDAQGLAEAARRMYLSSAEERQQMGLRGLEYYREHFEREKLLSRLESLMADVVRERKQAA